MQVVIGSSALIAVLVVFAWQQGGDDGGGGPLNAIAEAAERTQNKHGGRAAIHVIVSPSGRSKPFTMEGQAVFNDEDRTRGVMKVPHPDSGDPFDVEEIVDGPVLYVHSSRFGSLPGEAKWMSIDFSFGQDLDTSLPASVDAKGELALLEAVTGRVQKLGKESVRGVPTTRYRGTVSVSENADRLREEGADDLASAVEKTASPLQIEAWIDPHGLVRRMRMVQSQPSKSGDGVSTIDMRIDFSDFGINPAIDVPDSSEVFDATGLVEHELDG